MAVDPDLYFDLSMDELREITRFALAPAEQVTGLLGARVDPRIQAALEAARLFAAGRRRSKLQRTTALDGLLFAGGVGITPMLGILESLRKKNAKNKAVLIWSLRNENELAYSAELASFQKDMPNFTFVPFYSTRNGYLDAKKTEAICESAEVPYATSEFVLCGPKGFMHTIESTLVSKNVPKQKIHFESFGL